MKFNKYALLILVVGVFSLGIGILLPSPVFPPTERTIVHHATKLTFFNVDELDISNLTLLHDAYFYTESEAPLTVEITHYYVNRTEYEKYNYFSDHFDYIWLCAGIYRFYMHRTPEGKSFSFIFQSWEPEN